MPCYPGKVLQHRRLASLLIGIWLAGSAMIDVVAIQNFKSVERYLADPGIAGAQDIHAMGQDHARTLLRHLAAQQNRFYFEQWEWTELVLGLGLLMLLVFGPRPPKFPIVITVVMLVAVLAQRAFLTPEINRLTGVLDLLAPDAESAERKRFWMFHGIYSGVELLKIGLGLAVAALLITRRNPDPQHFARESELDALPVSRRVD